MKGLRLILFMVGIAVLCLVSGPLTTEAQGQTPSINAGGIVNVANYAKSVAPGSIAAIFGANLSDGTPCINPQCGPAFDSNGKVISTLAGATVTFNNFSAPILSTPNATQLNVQIPVELTGQTSATLVVTVAGHGSSAPVTVPLQPVSPGLISADASGQGQGAILNDRDANIGVQSFVGPMGSAPGAHPALGNDVIEIYFTGMGAMSPAVGTGMRPSPGAVTVATPTVTIGGVAAQVVASGEANCCVGLNQVNVRVHTSGVPYGNAVPVVLTAGGQTSNPVMIAVSFAGGVLNGTAQSINGSFAGVYVIGPSTPQGSTVTGNIVGSGTGATSGGQTVYSLTVSGTGTLSNCQQISGSSAGGNWTASGPATFTVSPAVNSFGSRGGIVLGTYTSSFSINACGTTMPQSSIAFANGYVIGNVSPTGQVTLNIVPNLSSNGGGGGNPPLVLQGSTAQSVSGSLPGTQLFDPSATGSLPIAVTGTSSANQTVYTGGGNGSGTLQCSPSSRGNWTGSLSATVAVSPAVTSLGTNGGSVSGSFSASLSITACGSTQSQSVTGTVTGTVSPGGATTLTLTCTSGCGNNNGPVFTGTATSISGTVLGTDIFDRTATGSVTISGTGASSGGQTVYSGGGSGTGTAQCNANGGTGTGTGNWTISFTATITVSPAVTSLVTSGGSLSGSFSVIQSGTLCGVAQNQTFTGTVTGTVSPGGAVTLGLN